MRVIWERWKSTFFSCQREKCVKSKLSREQRERRSKKRERHPRNHFFVGENNYISLQNYISSFSTRGCFCATLINTRARTTFSSLSRARATPTKEYQQKEQHSKEYTRITLWIIGEKRILQFLTKKHERVTNGRKPPKKNKKNTKLNDGSPLAGTPPRARNTKTTTLARRRMVLPRGIFQPYGCRRHAHVRRRVYVTVERGNRAVVEHVLEPMDVFWRRKFWTKSSTKRVDVFYGVRLV